MSALQAILDRRTITIGVCLIAAIAVTGILLDFLPILLLPLGAIALLLLVYNLEWPFVLLFFLLPLSWEQEFENGFGSDLPTEPLMIFLMGATVLYIIRNMHKIHSGVILSGLSVVLLMHYGWHWITAFFSESVFVSIKFSLAKTWYLVTFYFLAVLLLRKEKLQRVILKAVLIPLFIITMIILWRHYIDGFSFEAANFVMAPFFRNHVTSAAMMSVFLPYVIYLLATTEKSHHRVMYVLAILVLIAGIYFSYTRAAHISVLASFLIWPVLHFRLTRWAIIGGLIVSVYFVSTLVEDNKYMDYAPDFETTISHSSFEDLVSATYQGKDISTMERVYRWVAAGHMVQDNPILGFGPGNFYNFYKAYTVTNFQTYVSDNPEKSGVHCYYLMVLVEQGILGLSIFLAVLILALMKLEWLYHRFRERRDRLFVIAIAMSFGVIVLFQIINDLIETDKIGSFFFLNLALITVLEMTARGKKIISDDSLAE